VGAVMGDALLVGLIIAALALLTVMLLQGWMK
jgi:hypothetical protein